MKKSLVAHNTWKAYVATVRAKADELDAKGDAVTAEEKTELDGMLVKATLLKGDYNRIVLLEQAEEQSAIDPDPGAGREAKNNPAPGAPAVIPEGRTGQSRMLKVSNLWRGVMASGASGNMSSMKRYCGEELAISERLKAAGYTSESLGGCLFPLDENLLVEPVDSEGQPLADFSMLRKEIGERLSFKADPGEFGHFLKKFPEFAKSAFGLERKDLALGDDTLGGMLIPSVQSGKIIDLLRARAVVVKAGAREVALPPAGNIAYPRLTSDPTFTYTDPDSTSDATTSNIGTGVVRLLAKSLRGYVTIPNDLLRYSSPSVEAVVRMALAAKAALAEDNAFLESVGSSLAPKGIITYTPSTAETPTQGRLTLHVAQTVASDGNTLEPEDIALIQALYEEGNDPDPATAWIMRPTFWSNIRNKRADAVTAGDRKGPFIFDVTRSVKDGPADSLGDVPVLRTTQASKNRTKGGSTTLNYVLYGNFNRAIIGRVGVIEIATSEHVKFLQDKTIIRAVLRNDLGIEHEESFVFTDTLVNA